MMIKAGIDVGLETIKIVILDDDNNIIVKTKTFSGGGKRKDTINQLWQKCLDESKIDATACHIVATGMGKYDVEFANRYITESLADATAGKHYLQGVESIVDIGANQVRVIPINDDGSIGQLAFSHKCGSGLGLLLSNIALRHELSYEEMSDLAKSAKGELKMNEGCIVFAELDMLEMQNKNMPQDEIIAAVINGVAVKICSVMNDKVKPSKQKTVLLGGLALNEALVNAIKLRSGIDFVIPEFPDYGTAIGAALLAE